MIENGKQKIVKHMIYLNVNPKILFIYLYVTLLSTEINLFPTIYRKQKYYLLDHSDIQQKYKSPSWQIVNSQKWLSNFYMLKLEKK